LNAALMLSYKSWLVTSKLHTFWHWWNLTAISPIQGLLRIKTTTLPEKHFTESVIGHGRKSSPVQAK
jgi:hypothetical protein